jgi:hypothetical protein
VPRQCDCDRATDPQPILDDVEAVALAGVDARVALLLEQLEHLVHAEIRRHRDRKCNQYTRIARLRCALDELIDDALHGVATHEPAAAAAIEPGRAGIEQLEWSLSSVIVPTVERDGAHRVGLVDGDRRQDAVDAVDLRLVHAVEELPRVRREGLDVAALPLGVDRVENERRLARAGHARHYDELSQRDVDVQGAQIVLTRAPDTDVVVRVVGHRRMGGRKGGAGPSKLPRSAPVRGYFALPGLGFEVQAMRFFSALMPRETRFFALFNRHAAFIAEGGRAVAEMVRDYDDEDKRRRLVERIGEIERSADKVTHETVSLLHTTFITPFDRDDIHRLISTMDDILDLIQDAAESVQLYDIQTMPPDASRLASLLEDCCQHVKEAVELCRRWRTHHAHWRWRRRSTVSRATPMRSCAPASRVCSARNRTCARSSSTRTSTSSSSRRPTSARTSPT